MLAIGEYKQRMSGTYVESGLVVERGVERIADGEVDGDLEEVVLEHDEAGVHERRVAEQALEDAVLLLRRDRAGGNVPVCIAGLVSTFVYGDMYPKDVPLVSKGPPGPVVQMIGRMPMALEMARTRLSMSPKGARMKVGVTPSTVWIACRVHPSSATICSFVIAVRGCKHISVSVVAVA